MSTPDGNDAHGHADHGHDDHGHDDHHEPNFFRKYIWSHDHKMIGRQFLLTALIWLFVGGALALLGALFGTTNE